MRERFEIKAVAKTNFRAQYGVSVGATVLAYLVIAAASGITYGIGTLLIYPPMLAGLSYFSLCLYRGQEVTVGTLFTSGFSDYGRILGGILYMELFVWLWSLLFVIPGIVKSYAYSLTPYLLTDHPNIRATQAIGLSNRMTQGHKGKLFMLDLSFIGWMLLNGLTFGILGIFYVNPYMNVAKAGYYYEIKEYALSSGVIQPEELEGYVQQPQ